jgi:hypothetical protein
VQNIGGIRLAAKLEGKELSYYARTNDDQKSEEG